MRHLPLAVVHVLQIVQAPVEMDHVPFALAEPLVEARDAAWWSGRNWCPADVRSPCRPGPRGRAPCSRSKSSRRSTTRGQGRIVLDRRHRGIGGLLWRDRFLAIGGNGDGHAQDNGEQRTERLSWCTCFLPQRGTVVRSLEPACQYRPRLWLLATWRPTASRGEADIARRTAAAYHIRVQVLPRRGRLSWPANTQTTRTR